MALKMFSRSASEMDQVTVQNLVSFGSLWKDFKGFLKPSSGIKKDHLDQSGNSPEPSYLSPDISGRIKNPVKLVRTFHLSHDNTYC